MRKLRKPKKYTLVLGKERAGVDQMMARIGQEMDDLGFHPFPSTIQAVEEICVRASQAGDIDSPYSFGLCASTLLVGGAEKARAEGKLRIQVAHVMRSWEQDIAIGNCPPHKCVRRSILDNRAQVFERFPDLETIRERYLDELGD